MPVYSLLLLSFKRVIFDKLFWCWHIWTQQWAFYPSTTQFGVVKSFSLTCECNMLFVMILMLHVHTAIFTLILFVNGMMITSGWAWSDIKYRQLLLYNELQFLLWCKYTIDRVRFAGYLQMHIPTQKWQYSWWKSSALKPTFPFSSLE